MINVWLKRVYKRSLAEGKTLFPLIYILRRSQMGYYRLSTYIRTLAFIGYKQIITYNFINTK